MITACRAKLAQTRRAATTGLSCSHDRPDPSKAKSPPPPPPTVQATLPVTGVLGNLKVRVNY